MKGCLLWPLRLLFILVLLLLLGGAWLYRHELVGMWRFWRSGPHTEVPVTGRASAHGLAAATDLVDSLNGWRADSIVLTAEEPASLLHAGASGSPRLPIRSSAAD